jgi:hypothetical protein
MHTALTGLIAGAAHGLSVDSDDGDRTSATGQPRADRGVQEITVDRLQDTPQCGLVRTSVEIAPPIPSCPQHRQDVLRSVGGPFTDCGERPGTGDHRRRGHEQDRYESVPHPATSTRIWHHSEMFPQVSHLFRADRHNPGYIARLGQLMQRSRDRRRCNSRHDSLT